MYSAVMSVRVVVGNIAFLALGLAVVAAAAEWRLRATRPFMTPAASWRFVADVGLLYAPGALVRATNGLDYWSVSRANSLGFLDREPAPVAQTPSGCRVAVVGDSFVEAKHVAIADKLQVRLEALARRELPGLALTAAAFGRAATGQVQQLPFYDKYVRVWRPTVIVLVFVPQDLIDNAPGLAARLLGRAPARTPWATAVRGRDGRIALRPPNRAAAEAGHPAGWRALARRSWFGQWLQAKSDALLGDWRKSTGPAPGTGFERERLSPEFAQALDFTAFALDKFQGRARRDGASLLILATHRMRVVAAPLFERVRRLAAERQIDIVDQGAFIRGLGHGLKAAQWPHDAHWNAQGHQWAAQALLEHLRANPRICRPV